MEGNIGNKGSHSSTLTDTDFKGRREVVRALIHIICKNKISEILKGGGGGGKYR